MTVAVARLTRSGLVMLHAASTSAESGVLMKVPSGFAQVPGGRRLHRQQHAHQDPCTTLPDASLRPYAAPAHRACPR